MNKPNENQLEALCVIKRNISAWEFTNDIDSPTHTSDMGEGFCNLAEKINSEQADELYKKMLEILSIVRKIESPVATINVLKGFKNLGNND